MAQSINKILKALFDIKPLDDSGRVDAHKISKMTPVVNLAVNNPARSYGRVPRSVARSEDSSVKFERVVRFGPMLKPPYQIGNKKQNPIIELEKYLNSNLDTRKELEAVGAKVEKGGFDAKPRYRVIPNIKKDREIEMSDFNPEYLIHNTKDEEQENNYEATLKQINEKAAYFSDNTFIGEPKKVDPFEYWSQHLLTTSTEFPGGLKHRQEITPRQAGASCDVPLRPVAASSEIESWIRYAKEASSIKQASFAETSAGRQISSIFSVLSSKCNLLFKKRLFNRNNFLETVEKAIAIQSFAKSEEKTVQTRFCKATMRNGFNYNLHGSFFNSFLGIVIVASSALIFASFGQFGISVKNEIMKESNLAVANLESAKESLRVFDFESASNNFAEAYEEFSKAGDSLNFMGASITSLFAELPGGGKFKSAKNLVEAGKLLAEAGKSMSEAVSSLSQTGAILYMDTPCPYIDTACPLNIFGDLKKSLLVSGKNLSKANALISEVSLDALPEDKRESFSEFQSKLPELEGIVSDAVKYTSFFENLLGSDGIKKYLVLFQNNSELRPTGGFPGTYAVVTFKNGRLDRFVVDDIYNLDGQLKENIIPPKPLQHITPNWGMRDANWFVDFSVSAQKTMEFYEKITSRTCGDFTSPTCKGVDGVITMSPRMISDILGVVGPIEMPEYGYIVNDENFLSTIQAEVEYGDNREQPKKVVQDMAPRLLEKIYSSDPGQWLDIFNVFVSGLDKKDILMYFKDLNLESFVTEKGFGGLIKDTDGDYLMITLTNVKGSKTDAVTDNAITLTSKFETLPSPNVRSSGLGDSKSVIIHKLALTRRHNGGSSRFGFYNKQNPAYVRVLVPEGSELLNILGNSNPDLTPLINYSGTDFKQDDNLLKLESSFNFDSEKGVSVYRESGKTGFAFWLITDPGKDKTVELEYAVTVPKLSSVETKSPDSYSLYVQKQPGLEVDNFEFKVGDDYIYNGKFEKDLELIVTPIDITR